jgi:hypothetical protein
MAKDLEKLLEKQKQLAAQIQAIKAREKEADRKLDTRRKILIGGAVLAMVKRGDWNQEKLKSMLDREIHAEKDRALFGLPAKESKDEQAQ